jgi:hypothetical protein
MRFGSYKEDSLSLVGNFNDVMHHRLYFGRSDGGASQIEAKEFRVFENGVGQQEKNISTGAVVTLSPADSSQDGRGGTIPNAQAFVIAAIGIHVSVQSPQATTPKTDDSVDVIDVTPVQAPSPIPLVEAIANQCTFELWKNASIRLERGVINEYPCQFGLQGVVGGAQASVPVLGAGPAQAAYTISSQQIIQTNGMMFRPLTVLQILESLDEFYAVFEPRVAINLNATKLAGHVDFYLVGLLTQEDSARQLVATFGVEGYQ